MKKLFLVLIMLVCVSISQAIQLIKPVVGNSNGTWGTILNNYLDATKPFATAKEYGAIGNGTTDDTAAIQAAITGNGTVLISDGNYLVSATITIPSNRVILLYNTTIQLAANSNCNVFANSDPAGGNVFIQIIGSGALGSNIDGDGDNNAGDVAGIDFNNVTGGLVKGIRFFDCDYRGFHGTNSNVRVGIEDCYANTTAFVGIDFSATATSCWIKNCQTTACGVHGIAVSDGNDNTIDGCRSWSNGHSGIHLLADSNANYGQNNSITNCTTWNNGTTYLHHGVYTLFQTNLLISNLNSHDNAGRGLQVRDCNEVTFGNLQCNDNGYSGVYVARSASDVMRYISGGPITACGTISGHGISFIGVDYISVGPLTVADNNHRGLNFDSCTHFSAGPGASYGNLEGVRLTNATYSIKCSWGNLTGLNIHGNTNYGIYLLSAEYTAITGCTIYASGGTGIYEPAGGGPSNVTGNIILGNTVYQTYMDVNSLKTGNLLTSIALKRSATWDPASIDPNQEETKDITVTGAALGDFVRVSFSIDVDDLTLTAQVTAADTVTCQLSNNTGGAINLGSGTVRVEVIQK